MIGSNFVNSDLSCFPWRGCCFEVPGVAMISECILLVFWSVNEASLLATSSSSFPLSSLSVPYSLSNRRFTTLYVLLGSFSTDFNFLL